MRTRTAIALGAILLVMGFLVPLVVAGEAAYVGELTGDRVRIRAGGSLNHQILTHVSTGHKVLVREKKGDWLRIRVPSSVSLWISAKYVKVDADGKAGAVTGDRVNVRARKVNGDIMGQVNRGDRVIVRGRDGDWLRIAPPEQASAWIFAKYVKNIGPYDALREGLEVEDRFAGMMAQARDQYLVELQKEPQEREFSHLLALYEQIIAQAPSTSARQSAIAQRDFIAAVKEINEQFVRTMDPYKNLPEKLSELESKYQELIVQKAPKQYTVTGVVGSLGGIAFRPATHKLLKDGKTIYLIKSEDYDLDEYRGKLVGIVGTEEGQSWWGVPVMVVEDMDVLYQETGRKR